MPGKKPRKIVTTYAGNVSTFKFVDGSGTVTADVTKFPAAMQLHLMQGGLTRYLASGDPKFADVQKRITALMAGEFSIRQPKPKQPNALSVALANIAKRQGQGTMSQGDFAKLASVDYWQGKLFGVDGKGGLTMEQRAALRAKDDVQMEIRAVKIARAAAAKAAGRVVKPTAAPVDLKSI